ncbi:MAG: hypothetical protein IKR78_01245 [Dehalococcoidales bacterium]|nr:hypothetical protein [Dehalococcoidales bacterium]
MSIKGEKEKQICMYLKNNHTGQQKAVFSEELERLFSMNGRTIRRLISSLRQDGHPICSSSKGYYYAKTQEEINKTVSRLNELVTGVSNARTGLLAARLQEPAPIVEITIRIRGDVV